MLAAFSRSGALCPMDLTLGRGSSVKDVLSTTDFVPESKQTSVLNSFEERIKNFKFFRHKSSSLTVSVDEDQCSSTLGKEYSTAIPNSFEVASVITNDLEDVAVVTFRIPSPCDFYQLN